MLITIVRSPSPISQTPYLPSDDSDVLIVIVPTDEELMIAHDTYELVHDLIDDPDIDYNEDLLFF